MFGAGRVIAIDCVPERLAMAQAAKAETINFLEEDVHETLQAMTKGRGPDSCIDAVGSAYAFRLLTVVVTLWHHANR